MYLATVKFPGGDRTFEVFKTKEQAQEFIEELIDLEENPTTKIYEV